MGGIASVIHNRLEKNEPLGIDATTRYELDDWENPIPVEALEQKTPYNTRERRACPKRHRRPSKRALLRILSETTPYFYYLHGFDKGFTTPSITKNTSKTSRSIGNENKVA